jgi:hypothetical protein
MMSNNNGFSWAKQLTTVSDVLDLRSVAGQNADGSMVTLVISEDWDNLDVYYVEYIDIGGTFDLICVRYSLSDVIENGDDATDGTNITGEASGIIEEDLYQGQYDVAANQQEAFVTYDIANKLRIRRVSPRSTAVSAAVELATTPVFNIFSTTVNKDSEVAVLFNHQTGGENITKFVSYDETDGWGTPVTISNFGDTNKNMRDPSIAYDGYGNLCALWSRLDTSTDEVVIQYAISTDSGATWSVSNLTRTDGNTPFVDQATTDPGGRTQIIGGADGGWMFSYTETRNSYARTYVRRLTTSDGSSYTLGDEQEIAINHPNANIVGAHFFLPCSHARLMDIRDPGLVRVGFTKGDGSSTLQTDETPVSFEQECLFASAYPSVIASETTTYTQDTADDDSVLVSFEILGGPDENRDYYTLGVTGTFTERYLRAFDHIGNQVRLIKFEPDSNNWMDDRSAFGSPTEYNSKCIITPITYEMPSPELSGTEHTNYIEQDVRTIYLPPDIHLSRTFLVNKGGYLKRTVWLIYFDGNEYELSQVVPFFIKNQICYYSANAYVVGPSRDPFSRTILPSET